MLDISLFFLLYSHCDTNLHNLSYTFRSHSMNWLVFLIWGEIIISLLKIFMLMIIMPITALSIEYSWVIYLHIVLVFHRLLLMIWFSRAPVIIITIARCRIHSRSWIPQILRVYYFFRWSSILWNVTVFISCFGEHRTT